MALHMASLLSPLPGLLVEIHRDFYLRDEHLRPWVAPCQGSISSVCRSSPSFASCRLVFFPRSLSHLLAHFHHLILPHLSRSAFSARPPNVVVNKRKGICYGRWWMTRPIWRRGAPPTRPATCRPATSPRPAKGFDLAQKKYQAARRREFPSRIQRPVTY